jgi:hypothetical protein
MKILARISQALNGKGKSWLFGGATLAGLLVSGWAVSRAQSPVAGPSTTAQGRVQSFTTAPRGEVDGAMLDNGTWIHWPPHLQDRFHGILTVGDQVRATGRTETGPAGDTHFEVQNVTDLRSNATAENPDYAAGPPVPPRGPGRRGPRIATGPERTVTGMVRSLNTAPRGEIDGAVLDDGTLVHWPPHMQDRFRGIVAVGDQIRAVGRTETGPAGDTHFEVESVTNLRSNATVTNPDLAPLGPNAGVNPATGVPGPAIELEQRLRNLESRLDQLQREIEQLRRAR